MSREIKIPFDLEREPHKIILDDCSAIIEQIEQLNQHAEALNKFEFLEFLNRTKRFTIGKSRAELELAVEKINNSDDPIAFLDRPKRTKPFGSTVSPETVGRQEWSCWPFWVVPIDDTDSQTGSDPSQSENKRLESSLADEKKQPGTPPSDLENGLLRQATDGINRTDALPAAELEQLKYLTRSVNTVDADIRRPQSSYASSPVYY